MSSEVTKVTYDPGVELDDLNQQRSTDDINNISQLEMMQKLMELISYLQDIENMVNGTTLDALYSLAEQSAGMVDLSKYEQENSNAVMAEYNKQLEQQDHQSLMQKIFGTIISVLMMAVGMVMCVAGGPAAGAGAMMITMSVLSLTTTYCPEAIDKIFSGLDPAVAATIKSVIIVAATVIASALTLNPAIGIMMFTTMFTTFNPMEDIAVSYYMQHDDLSAEDAKNKAKNNDSLQKAILGVDICVTVIGGILSFLVPGQAARKADEAASTASKIADTTASGANAASKTGESAAKLAQSSNRITETLENGLQSIKKTMGDFKRGAKMIQDIAQTLMSCITSLFSLSNLGVATWSGYTEIQTGKIDQQYQILSASATERKTAQDNISAQTSQTDNFMQSMQQNYQSCIQEVINNIFSYLTTFANLYSQNVA